MFRYFLLALLLLNGCDCGGDGLIQTCPQERYCAIDTDGGVIPLSHPNEWWEWNTRPESDCTVGNLICEQETRELSCEGFVTPEEAGRGEICDNRDNNCDGRVDEGTNMSAFNPNNPCGDHDSACAANAICVEGLIVCELITPELCGEEVCDGLDNDGDGFVDEDSEEEPLFDELWEYAGSWETAGVGECRPGRMRCINGNPEAVGMVIPTPEVCGDGLDNDCDGIIDEVTEPDYAANYLFVIDVSGSMTNYVRSVARAACNFAIHPQLANSRFGIVFLGLQFALSEDQIFFGLDFSTPAELCEYMQAEAWNSNRGGIELAPEAMIRAHQSERMFNINGRLELDRNGDPAYVELSWDEELSKRVVVFTDEPIQYRLFPPDEFGNSYQQTPQDLIDDCLENKYGISVFTHREHWIDWYDPMAACPGFIDVLHADEYYMEQALLNTLLGGC